MKRTGVVGSLYSRKVHSRFRTMRFWGKKHVTLLISWVSNKRNRNILNNYKERAGKTEYFGTLRLGHDV